MDKELSERKKKILCALVDSYINTAEPIASGAIRENFLPEVSGATIRNELAALEEMGYLVKPHISAGRVPSSAAYKFYVEHLELDLQMRDVEDMRAHFNIRMTELQDIVKETAKIISDTTNYTSIVMLNEWHDLTIKNVRLTDLGDGTALIIVVTDEGVIHDKVITLPRSAEEGYIEAAEDILKEAFRGKKLTEASLVEEHIEARFAAFRVVFEQVAAMLTEMRGGKKSTLYLEGASKIFEHPEYGDINNVKQFMSVIEGETLAEIMEDEGDIEFSIKIGKDAGMDNMALVTAKYTVNGKEVGRAGVIGPERMNYKQVLKVLSGVKKATKRINKN